MIVETDDSVHFTFGETFRILVVYDDPTIPSYERKGTDAQHFNLTKSGTEVFRSRSTTLRRTLRSPYTTFVYANGDVRVDREFGIPPPPC